MSEAEDFGGGKRVERAEIERRVREIVARNQEVLRSVPEDVGGDEYWRALQREGRSATLSVRRLEGGGMDEQFDMFFIDVDGQAVEMTYFVGDEVAASFWVDLNRIESLE